MKTKAAFFFALCVAAQAWAGPLPDQLHKSIKPLDVQSADLSGGVLTLVSNKSDINLEQFEFAVTNAVCAPWLMDGARGWGGQNIDRIEISNRTREESYAVGNVRQVCRDIGRIEGGAEPVRRYLKTKGRSCSAGKCGAISH